MKPTKVQREILCEMAEGATIQTYLLDCSHYLSGSGRSVRKQTLVVLLAKGWIRGREISKAGREVVSTTTRAAA